MLWIIGIVLVALIVIGNIIYNKSYDYDFIGTIIMMISISASVIWVIIITGIIIDYPYKIEDKIIMYQEENDKIEEKVKNTIGIYMEYEKDTYKEFINDASLEVLIARYPELKANELVKSKIEIYIENNKKIKELKEKEINKHMLNWWLYFGK